MIAVFNDIQENIAELDRFTDPSMGVQQLNQEEINRLTRDLLEKYEDYDLANSPENFIRSLPQWDKTDTSRKQEMLLTTRTTFSEFQRFIEQYRENPEAFLQDPEFRQELNQALKETSKHLNELQKQVRVLVSSEDPDFDTPEEGSRKDRANQTKKGKSFQAYVYGDDTNIGTPTQSSLKRKTYENTKEGREQRQKDIQRMARNFARLGLDALIERSALRSIAKTFNSADFRRFNRTYQRAKRSLTPAGIMGRAVDKVGEQIDDKIVKKVEAKVDRVSSDVKNRVKKSRLAKSGFGKFVGRNFRRAKNAARGSTGIIGAAGRIAGSYINAGARKISEVTLGLDQTKRISKTFSNVRGRVGEVTGKISGGLKNVAGAGKFTGRIIGNGMGTALKTGAIGSAVALASGGGAAAVLPAALIAGGAGFVGGAAVNTVNNFVNMTRTGYKASEMMRLARAGQGLGIGPLKDAPRNLAKFWMKNTTQVFDVPGNVVDRVKAGGSITNLVKGVRAFNTGLNGATIGSLAGLALSPFLGPQAALIGTIAGAGIGVGGQLIGDSLHNRVLGKLASGKLFETLGKMPLRAFEGVVRGNQWLGGQVKLALSENNLIDDRLKLSGAEKTLYGWDNPLNIGLNSMSGIGYLLSMNQIGSFLANGGTSTLAQILQSGILSRIPGLSNLVNALRGVTNLGATINVAGRAISATSAGMMIGGTIGTAIGTTLALLAGLEVGLFAAIGGAVGTVAGGIIGGAVAGGASGGFGTFAGVGIGSTIGSSVGTFLGSLVDNIISSIMPFVPNPITIIMGLYNMYKFYTAPLRKFSDYADLVSIGFSLVTFLVTFSKMASNGSFTPDEDQNSQAMLNYSNTKILYAAEQIDYSEDMYSLVLNKDGVGEFNFQNVQNVSEIDENSIIFVHNGVFWNVDNIDQFSYSDPRNSLRGTGANILATIYSQSIPYKQGSEQRKQFAQINFCQINKNLCEDRLQENQQTELATLNQME